MVHRSRATLFAVLVAAVQPVAAQTAPVSVRPAATAPPNFADSMAFVARLGEIVSLQTASVKKLMDAKPLMDSLATQAGIETNGPKLRAVIAEARSGIKRSDAMMSALAPPDVSVGTMSLADMVGEARRNTAQSLVLLDDYDGFVSALMRGDQAAARSLAPKLMSGAFVMMDTMRSTYRNRQAITPATSSVHQAVGVGAQLYRAMGEAGRGWYNAVVARQGAAAATQLRSELQETSRELRALSKTGRANLARELADLDGRSVGFSGSDAAAMARLRSAFAHKEGFFAMADELAALCDKAAPEVSAAALARQPEPALLAAMVPLELRFHKVVATQAQAATAVSSSR